MVLPLYDDNPFLVRLLMERGPHVFLSGAGADALGVRGEADAADGGAPGPRGPAVRVLTYCWFARP